MAHKRGYRFGLTRHEARHKISLELASLILVIHNLEPLLRITLRPITISALYRTLGQLMLPG